MRIIEKEKIQEIVNKALETSRHKINSDSLSFYASCTDHTTLSEYDSPESIKAFTEKATETAATGLAPVASICVFPSLIESVGLSLGESPIAIAAVCGAFPHGQSYIEVKMLECAMAIENGADEIEIVLNIGAMLAGNTELVKSEIAIIKEEIAGDALLKVTLEAGSLVDPKLIYLASRIAIDAGADFIKTSTGTNPVSATGPAAAVICLAIDDHYTATGSKTGFIAAGGVDQAEDAVFYRSIAQQILGNEWLTPELLRMSSGRLLADISGKFGEI